MTTLQAEITDSGWRNHGEHRPNADQTPEQPALVKHARKRHASQTPQLEPLGHTTQPPPRGRLRQNTIALVRGEDEVQLGLDPRWAVRIGGLNPAELNWLLELAERKNTSSIVAARRHGVTPNRLAELISVLAQTGYWLPNRRRNARHAVRASGGGAADWSALGLLRSDGDARQTLRNRAKATVAIMDSGRLGATIARHLATAGVGRLILPDTNPVELTDLGLGGYRRDDIGCPRFERLRAQLADTSLTVPLTDGTPDVVIVIETHAWRPGHWLRLLGEAVPHLLVLASEAQVEVGPFVLPGRTACANCRHLEQTDLDPAWPQIWPQLKARPSPPVETTLTANAAAAASSQVLAYLDGQTPDTARHLHTFSLPQAICVRTPVRAHPECGCTGLRAKKPAS